MNFRNKTFLNEILKHPLGLLNPLIREKNFAKIFEDVRDEQSLSLLLSLTEERFLKQSGFRHYEMNILKNLALEKPHRQKTLKPYMALQLLNQ